MRQLTSGVGFRYALASYWFQARRVPLDVENLVDRVNLISLLILVGELQPAAALGIPTCFWQVIREIDADHGVMGLFSRYQSATADDRLEF